MNLRRIRLTLTAWYVVVLVAIISVMGVVAYVALSRALSSEVDNSLESSAIRLADQVRDRKRSPTTGNGPNRRTEHDGDGGSDELEYLTGASGDVFYAILAPDGTTLDNPLNVDLSRLALPDGVKEALDKGLAWRTTKAGDEEYRLLFFAVSRNGTPTAIVAAGRSLEPHHHDLTNLALVLLATSAGGLALAVVGGLYVSGRALRPVRESYDKQRSFISDASHELRTPLTLIRASAEAIQRGRKSTIAPDDAEALDDIVLESDRMSLLVADLLTLAQLDEIRIPLRRQDIDLSELLAAAGRRAGIMARGHGIAITVDVQPGLHANADPAAVERVLGILVDNAVRYAGGRGTIEIRGSVAGSWAEVSVSDAGPGLDPEDLKRVFERFYRTDQSRTKETGGTGLGLSIARGIIEAHGGHISAESKPGAGATFRFTLPRAI